MNKLSEENIAYWLVCFSALVGLFLVSIFGTIAQTLCLGIFVSVFLKSYAKTCHKAVLSGKLSQVSLALAPIAVSPFVIFLNLGSNPSFGWRTVLTILLTMVASWALAQAISSQTPEHPKLMDTVFRSQFSRLVIISVALEMCIVYFAAYAVYASTAKAGSALLYFLAFTAIFKLAAENKRLHMLFSLKLHPRI
jgi:hypothetical protein